MNILDFIFIAVVVLTVFFAAKKGFVLSLIEFVSGLLAIFISYALPLPWQVPYTTHTLRRRL